MRHIGGGSLRADLRPRRAAGATAGSTRTSSTSTSATSPRSGFDRDDMTMSPITYDEMRPGCYDPKARVEDMLDNHVDVSLSFPTFPRFCGQTFPEAKDRELGLACVYAYNDWMVEEWCGDSDGRLVPLMHHPAVGRRAGRRRGAPQRRPGRATRCASARSRRTSGCRASTPATGIRSSQACQETETVVCMHIGSSSQMPATSADAPVAVAATLSFGNAMASLSDFLFSGVLVRFPDAEARVLRGPDRLAAVHPRAGRRRVARAPGVGRRGGHRSPSRRRPTTTGRSTAASSATGTARVPRAGRRRQHHVRDRLPAHRLDVAAHQGGRQGDDGAPADRRHLQDRPGQRDPHALASTSPDGPTDHRPSGPARHPAARPDMSPDGSRTTTGRHGWSASCQSASPDMGDANFDQTIMFMSSTRATARSGSWSTARPRRRRRRAPARTWRPLISPPGVLRRRPGAVGGPVHRRRASRRRAPTVSSSSARSEALIEGAVERPDWAARCSPATRGGRPASSRASSRPGPGSWSRRSTVTCLARAREPVARRSASARAAARPPVALPGRPHPSTRRNLRGSGDAESQ